MSAMPKAIRSSRVSPIGYALHDHVQQSSYPEIDEETFKVMWEMSAPGGEAEGCFLRLPQTDYFYDGRDPHLEWMPDVCTSTPYHIL